MPNTKPSKWNSLYTILQPRYSKYSPEHQKFKSRYTVHKVSILYIISHFIHVLYDNSNVNTATKLHHPIFPQVDPHYEWPNTRWITHCHILNTKPCFQGSSYLPFSKFITITQIDCWTGWSPILWTFQLEHTWLNNTRRETSKPNTSILP